MVKHQRTGTYGQSDFRNIYSYSRVGRQPDTGFRLHDELPGRGVPAARVRAPLPPDDPAGDGERHQAVRDVCRLPGDWVRAN